MTLEFRTADEASVRAFLGWRYDPPYDIYNIEPDQEEVEMRYFLQPKTACYTLIDKGNDLTAFCTFGEDGQVPGGKYGDDALDIGMGVRPDLTGRGSGHVYVNAVLDFARRMFSPRAFRVTVAEFNQRAFRVWEKAGFRRVQSFERVPDGKIFVILRRDA